MRAKRTKTDAFDWAAIRWARLREEAERVEEPRLAPPKDERGRLVDPLVFLSERARVILSDAGISADQFRERVLGVWFFSLIFVAALGAFVFPFARADRLLGGGVNLAGPFVFFLLGQIFFLATSLIFVGIAVFQSILRRFRKSDAPRTFAETTVERLCGLVGWLALVGLHRGIRGFYRFLRERNQRVFWKKFALKDAKTEENAKFSDAPSDRETAVAASRNALRKEIALRFWDSIFEKPRFLFFWGGALSHLFWASCSICVLAILVVRMQGNRYDYCWNTSLEDERAVKKCVDFLGAPIAKFWGGIPTEEDVRQLFVDERPPANALGSVGTNGGASNSGTSVVVLESDQTNGDSRVAPTLKNRKMEAKTRARWSRFLLTVVFVWCVAPRCFLVGVYYFLLKRSLRDFRPDLRAPYFKALIDREEAYSTTTNSVVVFDPPDVEESEIVEADLVSETPQDLQNAPTLESPQDLQNTLTLESSQSAQNASTLESSQSVQNAPTLESPQDLQNVPTLESPRKTPIALALGYDATLSAERWREALGTARSTTVFGDVAADFDAKKRFRTWAKSNGADVEICAVATDVSLSPARHCVKFLREDLGATFSNAQIFVVLSGGEKLRRKFGATAPEAVSQRVQDWRGTLADASKMIGVPFEPIFFDAELDLPEERDRLRRVLSGASNGPNAYQIDAVKTVSGASPKSAEKWRSAIEKIDAASRAIFAENAVSDAEAPSEAERDERDRRRIARLCAEIFAIYREEAAASAGGDARDAGFDGATLARQISKIGERATERLEKFGEIDRLGQTLVDKGVAAGLEEKLSAALGLTAKMRVFSRQLSPKCALAVGALGVSAPILATFAPLFGGALTASAVASTLGAFGTLLPSALASGATGAALGAVAPTTLAACKRKLVEKRSRAAAPDPEAAVPRVFPFETLESVAAVVCASTTWVVALELQGRPEDEIVAALPVATEPLERSALDAPETVRQALDEVCGVVQKLR